MNVVIKEIPDLHGLYLASSDGRIYSVRSRKWLAQSTVPDGYKVISIQIAGILRKTFRVHRLVAMAFIPNTNNYDQINHLNGIKTDNRVENLEWSNASLNKLHAIKIGLVKISQAHRDAARVIGRSKRKLTYEQAKEIRNINLSHQKTADLYGVSKRCITFIRYGKRYHD